MGGYRDLSRAKAVNVVETEHPTTKRIDRAAHLYVAVYEFLEYIGMSPVPEFAYKWDTIVKQSYRGRECLQCGTVFDAKVNHNVYCADKCYKLAWKRRQSRPVAVRRSG